MENFLQFLGTIGIVTLGSICVALSMNRYTHLRLVSSQTIFRWLSLTIISIGISRALSATGILELADVRTINSLVFLVSVTGIVWSISRHARKQRSV